jgi:hypothetical protein
MIALTQVAKVELIGPTAVGVHLTDDRSGAGVGPVVINPNDFITDFSTFLTAMRAAGATHSIACDPLKASWRKTRQALRKQLVEEDPWGPHVGPHATDADALPEYWSMVLCLGEEGAQKLLKKRCARREHNA